MGDGMQTIVHAIGVRRLEILESEHMSVAWG